MRVDYAGHDRQYERRKKAGLAGWNSEEDAQQNIARLRSDLDRPYIPRSGSLLEAGCGAGDLSLLLAGQGYRVHGIDISPIAVEWARDKARKQSLDAEYVVGDVRTLERYADSDFDIVLDGYCLHCLIGDDRQQFLASVYRVLRPGGLFLVNTMCNDPAADRIRAAFDSVTRCVMEGDIATRFLGMPEGITAELREAGFEILFSQVNAAGNSLDQDLLHVDACKPVTRQTNGSGTETVTGSDSCQC